MKQKLLLEMKMNEIRQRENLMITEDHKQKAAQLFRTTFSNF